MLTASSDNAVDGTAGPDTISANHLTIQNTDILKGGAGTDTLTILNTGAALSIAPAILTDVENIQVTSSTGATSSAVNLIAATGVEKVISKSSVVADSFTNIQSLASVEIDGTAAAVTASFKDTLATSSATVNVAVKNGAVVSALNIGGATHTAEFGTVAITSTGAANTLTAVLDGAGTDVVTKLDIAGSGDLTVGAAGTRTAITTIDAADMTGAFTVYATGANLDITGGSGNDTIDIDGIATFFSSSATEGHNVVGGSGTDTLVLNSATTDSGTTTLTSLATTSTTVADHTVTGIETLNIVAKNTATGDADVTTAVKVSLFGASTVNVTATNLDADATSGDVVVNLTGVGSEALTVTATAGTTSGSGVKVGLTKTDASAVATEQSLTLSGAVELLTISATTGTDVAGGVETLSITGTGTTNTVASLVAFDTTTLNISSASGKATTITAIDTVDSTSDDANAVTATNQAAAAFVINASGAVGNVTLGSASGAFRADLDQKASITLGSGTNAVYMGTVTALADTIVGTAGASDTVYITDAGASGITFAATVTDVENLVIDTTASSSQTFNLANTSATTNVKLVDAVDGEGFAVALSNINGQTVEVATQEKASASLSSDTDDVDFSGVVITAGKATAATGVSLKVSGAAQEATATSSFAGIFKTSGVATVNNATSDGTYALNLNLDFDGVSATDKLTGLVLTGGGAASASANTTITVATDNSHVNLTSLDATGYTGNVVASSMAFDSSTNAAAVRLASVQNITLAAGELARDQLTITGGSGANTVIAAAVTGDLRMASTSVETYSIALRETDDSDLAATTIDFRDTTGVTNLALLIAADTSGSDRADIDETLTISNLASGATVSFGGADANGTDYGVTTGDITTINAAVSLASSLNINNTGAAGAVTIEDLELGSTYTNLNIDSLIASKAFTIDSLEAAGLTTLNLRNNSTASAGTLTVTALVTTALGALTIDSTKGAVTVSNLGTVNSLETLTVDTGVAASGGKTTITAGTSTSIDAITASGTGAFEITALSASSLDSINASGVTGVVTLGSTTTSALTTAAGASITTGTANDIVSVNSSTLGTVTLGSVTNSDGVLTDNDTLYLIGAQGSGTGVIDLSQSGDQILTINGQSNTSVQTGIDSVNVASMTSINSYGWTLTARSAGSTITGSGYNDVINGGAGADALNGGAGADTIATNGGGDTVTGGAGNDTITLGTGADTVVFADTASNNGDDSITSFTAGASADVLNFDAFLGTSAAFLDAGSTTISGAIGATNAGAETTGTAIAAKVILVDVDTIADTTAIAGLIAADGAATIDDKLVLADGEKAVILLGDVNSTSNGNYLVYYVVGTDTTTDDSESITLVGTLNSVDLDAFVAGNLF
jgi:hypothetical protein